MKYLSEHRNGLIATAVTHGVILAMLLLFGIVSSIPIPPLDEGILVNFGDSETGLGLIEPAPGEREPSIKPVEAASVKQVIPPPSKKVVTPVVPQAVAKSQKAIQDAITKYGSISNIPNLNDSKLGLAISNNDLNLALNS